MTNTMFDKGFIIFFVALSLSSIGALAADNEFTLAIQDHKFQPETLIVPARIKIKLTIENRDATAEEFESFALGREKVIPAKSSAVVYIGPLQPGNYPFVGEFNEKTANGVIVAK